ncbi:hypothetical protein BGY98DRAFT_1179060 [Russula aff. rugulosa BPL654]|nr:hypothetical protein BGY98DRAFT_1179060 [Russula aff. rugulosa BPL654]
MFDPKSVQVQLSDHRSRFPVWRWDKNLWADKSSRAFDRFIGELMEQMRDRSAVELCTEPVPTTYRGYKAILGKLGYHASDIQPRVRWTIVFSGLCYMIVYIPRTPGRPQMYCSPVMRFCLRPDDEQEPAIQPPIWSVVVYMLLVETLNIDDDDLRQQLGLVVPMGDPDLGSKIDARGCRRSGRTVEVDETLSHPIKVRNLFSYSFGADDSEFFRVHRKLQLVLRVWSSRSHVVIKFAAVPKKDKAELVHQLSDEKAAYEKLNRIAGWIIPRLYGEYEWYGGRALILSDEEHGDFEPQNVLRKRWPCFLKIIDFGFSDVDHTCPGWKECSELKERVQRSTEAVM